MHPDALRDLGPQPIAEIMTKLDLRAPNLVSASTEQISHKMVSRACKGRRLTPRVKIKIRNAINAASGNSYAISDLFTY